MTNDVKIDMEDIPKNNYNISERNVSESDLSSEFISEKLKKNNGWNDKNEQLIVNLGESAAIYKKLHDKQYNNYKIVDTIINLILLILTVFLSTESILNFFQISVLAIIDKIIIFIIALISIFNNVFKYNLTASEHAFAANSFSMLYLDILATTCISRVDRPNAVKYIQQIMKTYDHLEVSSPKITVPKNMLPIQSKFKMDNENNLKEILKVCVDITKDENKDLILKHEFNRFLK